jgi:hypothetical protein
MCDAGSTMIGIIATWRGTGRTTGAEGFATAGAAKLTIGGASTGFCFTGKGDAGCNDDDGGCAGPITTAAGFAVAAGAAVDACTGDATGMGAGGAAGGDSAIAPGTVCRCGVALRDMDAAR